MAEKLPSHSQVVIIGGGIVGAKSADAVGNYRLIRDNQSVWR